METSPASPAVAPDPEAVAVIAARAPDHEHPAVFWLIVLLFWRLYETTGCYNPTPYNAHVLLAWSMLHGHFYLIDPPPYVEMVTLAGRSYVAYGIGPSLLMLPLVALWGLDFNQPSFNAALGGLAVALWWSITGLLGLDYWKRVWLTLIFATGSLFCFAAGQNGNTWSLMHVTTVFGLMIAIDDVLGSRRGWVAGLGFGIAVLSRQPALLALPFFAVMLWSGAARGSSARHQKRTRLRGRSGHVAGLRCLLQLRTLRQSVRQWLSAGDRGNWRCRAVGPVQPPLPGAERSNLFPATAGAYRRLSVAQPHDGRFQYLSSRPRLYIWRSRATIASASINLRWLRSSGFRRSIWFTIGLAMRSSAAAIRLTICRL